MTATNPPQAVATTRSRRRWRAGLGAGDTLTGLGLCWGSSGRIGRSYRAVEHARPFHQRDDIEEDDKRAEDERKRDRAIAPAALLGFGKDDRVRLFRHISRHAIPGPHAAACPRR